MNKTRLCHCFIQCFQSSSSAERISQEKFEPRDQWFMSEVSCHCFKRTHIATHGFQLCLHFFFLKHTWYLIPTGTFSLASHRAVITVRESCYLQTGNSFSGWQHVLFPDICKALTLMMTVFITSQPLSRRKEQKSASKMSWDVILFLNF